MNQTIHESAESNSWFHYLAWLPIPLFLIIILLLAWFGFEVVWNPPFLFTVLNIIFLTLIMLFVSLLAVRSYLVKKSAIIMLLGSGTLAIGLGGLIAGIAILGNNPNSTVSIYNTSACISGFLILTSAILSITMRSKILRSSWPFLASYLAVITLISVVAFLVYIHVWPVYFVQGTGPTAINLAVLYATITLFAVSAILLLIHSVKDGLNFRIWYGLGLGLIAVGLFGVSLQMGIGDPLNWMGRISQYLGAVYILIAIILSIRETHVWLLPWQQSLYETEEKYHSLYTSMNEGVALHKILYNQAGQAADYIIMDVNPSYEEILGLKREDVINRKASEIYGTANPPYLDIYSSVAETGNPKTFETYFEPMNRYFNISVFSPKQGEFATIFENITRRKKAEKQIEYHSLLLSKVNDAIIGSDSNFQINYWNKGAEQMYGYTEAEAWGKTTIELLRPTYAAGEREKIIDELKRQDSSKAIIHTRHRNGTEVIAEVNSTRIKDEAGSTSGYVVVYHDITKRQKATEELKRSSEELAKTNADLKQFAYVASHDLREPLRMITSFLQLLERRYKDQLDQNANEFIGFAVDGAKRLDKMIMDLLEYSRVANQQMQFNDVGLQEVMDRVLSDLKVLIKENGAQITYDSLPTIWSDENLLVRLFQNLISNSIKYRREEAPIIHISAEKEGNKYVFIVKDNGMGIDPQNLERIFTLFHRLHTHEEYEGSGIGLTIAQRIVHQHGGEIWAESEPGKGSAFYFTIPINVKS